MVCKCNTPFKLADEVWVNDHGDWGPRRTYVYLNNCNPSILQCVHANHDIKLITNGKDMKDIVWYVSNYSMKGMKKLSNISTLLAKMFIYHRQDSEQNSELTRINKWLIQQCGNTSSRDQELSAPEVVNYLMGWGDRFILHHFKTIHWQSACNLLLQTYPILQRQRYYNPCPKMT